MPPRPSSSSEMSEDASEENDAADDDDLDSLEDFVVDDSGGNFLSERKALP